MNCLKYVNKFYIIITDKFNAKTFIVISALLVANLVAWVISIIIYQSYISNSISILVLSYILGLKHALDADHIAAIDNVCNKLIQNGQQPVTVGMFFSLGHSTIVIIVSLLLAILSDTFYVEIENYNNSSDIIGSTISIVFLLSIGFINLISVFMIYKNLKNIKKLYENHETINWNETIRQNGVFSNCFGSTLFKIVNVPWKMYFVGFLFGLGFDTATEIALLGIIVIQSANKMSSWIIMPLPILFTCGMVLIDTIDGIIVTNLYKVAILTPIKKMYYNFVITSVSFIFALLVGLIGLLSLIQPIYSDDNTDNSFWQFIILLNNESNLIIMIGTLGSSIIIGVALSKLVFEYNNFKNIIEYNPNSQDDNNEVINNIEIVSNVEILNNIETD
jgi:high-affinity nickel-transport protein